jgi:hypothetical protein
MKEIKIISEILCIIQFKKLNIDARKTSFVVEPEN